MDQGECSWVQTLHIVRFLTLKNNNSVNTFGQLFLRILTLQRCWAPRGFEGGSGTLQGRGASWSHEPIGEPEGCLGVKGDGLVMAVFLTGWWRLSLSPMPSWGRRSGLGLPGGAGPAPVGARVGCPLKKKAPKEAQRRGFLGAGVAVSHPPAAV